MLGTDDRDYRKPGRLRRALRRRLTWWTRPPAHARLIAKKNHGHGTWSPDGRYLLIFDGKDWSTISVPDGKTVNLTAEPAGEVLQ